MNELINYLITQTMYIKFYGIQLIIGQKIITIYVKIKKQSNPANASTTNYNFKSQMISQFEQRENGIKMP
jgi:hypothetical protein